MLEQCSGSLSVSSELLTLARVSRPSLTLARPFVGQKFVALLAAALEGAHCVPAEVIAAAVVLQAFVNVWERKNKEKVGKDT